MLLFVRRQEGVLLSMRSSLSGQVQLGRFVTSRNT